MISKKQLLILTWDTQDPQFVNTTQNPQEATANKDKLDTWPEVVEGIPLDAHRKAYFPSEVLSQT